MQNNINIVPQTKKVKSLMENSGLKVDSCAEDIGRISCLPQYVLRTESIDVTNPSKLHPEL